jgi:hypothetical protein
MKVKNIQRDFKPLTTNICATCFRILDTLNESVTCSATFLCMTDFFLCQLSLEEGQGVETLLRGHHS